MPCRQDPSFIAVVFLSFISLTSCVIRPTEEYCAISRNHTMCLYPYEEYVGERCKKLPFAAHEITTLVKTHNTWRNNVALGMDRVLPTAANMHMISWDLELAEIAQRWANQCIMRRDLIRNVRSSTVGQAVGLCDRFTDCLNVWYSAKDRLTLDQIEDYTSLDLREVAQILKSNVSDIGCGRVQIENDQHFVVCNYKPSAWIYGQKIYQPGPPCSECRVGLECHNIMVGLCATALQQIIEIYPELTENNHSFVSRGWSSAYAMAFLAHMFNVKRSYQ